MKILIIDPFYEHSHAVWAEGLIKHSHHQITLLTSPPYHWKWKMVGGALELAQKYQDLETKPDLILASDMLDLCSFIAHSKINRSKVCIAIYFHENQISYPWYNNNDSAQQEKNHHYGFINFQSSLVADQLYFNSTYHMQSFLGALPNFLKMFPKFSFQKHIDSIEDKSEVLPIGLDLLNVDTPKNTKPTFLWNHRWEQDKNPELFFKTLFALKEKKVSFELIVTGKSYERKPPIFAEAKEILKQEIISYGHVESQEEYHTLLTRANILLVTSHQDFFGISIVEAISKGLFPLLPNRLAYPEHIPEAFVDECFYLSDEQLLPKLIQLIKNKKYMDTDPLRAYVQKYHWQNLIRKYDESFTNLYHTKFDIN